MATTTLTIVPNFGKKTARFRGTVAAGEHVAVSIQNDGGYVSGTANLRLRVVSRCDGRTLAVFPQPDTSDAWGADVTPLSCTLNLNTVQMLKAVPPAATVPLLFVLDDREADTLYFKGEHDVTHWPQERGGDVPYDLAGYPDDVKGLKEELEEYQRAADGRIDAVGAAAADAVMKASSSKASAEKAVSTADYAKAVADSAAEEVERVTSGKADLVDGVVPSSQLPSYVDDVLEFPSLGNFPEKGESGKIYLAVDTHATYRWSGTTYVDLADARTDDNVTETSRNAVRSSGIWRWVKGLFASRKVNGRPLSADVSLNAADVGALPAEEVTEGSFSLAGLNDINLPTETYVNGEGVVTRGDVAAPDENADEDDVALAKDTYEAIEDVRSAIPDVVAPSSSASAGAAADARATGKALAKKPDQDDVALSERSGFSEWECDPPSASFYGNISIRWSEEYEGWYPFGDAYMDTGAQMGGFKGGVDSTSLSWVQDVDGPVGITATRRKLSGYILGLQTSKPLASEAEAEELRDGKLDRTSPGGGCARSSSRTKRP